jgi:hypothetical protein
MAALLIDEAGVQHWSVGCMLSTCPDGRVRPWLGTRCGLPRNQTYRGNEAEHVDPSEIDLCPECRRASPEAV